MENKIINNKKIILAFVTNIIIVLLEIFGLILSVKRHGLKVFHYYTENSNYLTLIISLIFCINCIYSLISKKQINTTIIILRFISTTCLTITLLVVLFILIPMFPNTAIFMLFRDSNLYQHTLCPLISIISFLFFENDFKLNKKSIFLATLPTIVYGLIFITLNLFKVVIGPYPFFYVYEIPWYSSIMWLSIILFGSIIISIVLFAIYNRHSKANLL